MVCEQIAMEATDKIRLSWSRTEIYEVVLSAIQKARTMLTEKERELVRDTRERLKRPWAGVGDYSSVEALVQTIAVQGKALARAKTLVEKLDNIRVRSPMYAIDGGNFGPRPYDQELDALRAALELTERAQ